jgi:hypothetical protein
MTRTTRRRTGSRSSQPVGLVQVVPRTWPAATTTLATAAAGNRNWVLIGDDRLFFLFCTNAAGYGWYGRSSAIASATSSASSPATTTPPCSAPTTLLEQQHSGYWSYPGQFNGYGLVSSLDFTGKVLLRNHTQLGNPVRFGLTSLNTNNGQQICGRGPMPFPNGADYSLWLLPTYVRQEDGHMRGILPGMLWMPQDRPYSDQTIVDNVVGQAGKRFLAGQDAVQLGNRRRADRVRHHRPVEVSHELPAERVLRHGSCHRLHRSPGRNVRDAQQRAAVHRHLGPQQPVHPALQRNRPRRFLVRGRCRVADRPERPQAHRPVDDHRQRFRGLPVRTYGRCLERVTLEQRLRRRRGGDGRRQRWSQARSLALPTWPRPSTSASD